MLQMCIRDSIDTAHDSGDDLTVSVKNIMNEAYCRDISIKTRSSLDVKPVSYTHLDVYKRQQEDWRYIKDAMRMRDVSPSLASFLAHPGMTVECIYVPLLMACLLYTSTTRQIFFYIRQIAYIYLYFTVYSLFRQ